MSAFISFIVDFLSIPLTLGNVTMTIGQILGAGLVLRIAITRFYDEFTGDHLIDSLDAYNENADNAIRQQRQSETDEFWSNLHHSEPDDKGWFDGQNF